MNRTLLTAALFLGATFAAHADTNVWTDMSRQHRSDYQLHSDTRYCRHMTGPDLNGVPTSRAMKSCMRHQGWRFQRTVLEPWTWRRYGYGYGRVTTARQD